MVEVDPRMQHYADKAMESFSMRYNLKKEGYALLKTVVRAAVFVGAMYLSCSAVEKAFKPATLEERIQK